MGYGLAKLNLVEVYLGPSTAGVKADDNANIVDDSLNLVKDNDDCKIIESTL